MASEKGILPELLRKREENIAKSLKWPIEDLREMISTYQTALEIAIDSGELESEAVLKEKINQLEAALSRKVPSPGAEI